MISNPVGDEGAQEAPEAVLSGLASAHDVFLSPHSDDVCFSLGALAYTRKRGLLLTVFPVSGYTAAKPQGDPVRASAITRLRMGEDAAFARAVGMKRAYLPFKDAQLRGQFPFDPRAATDVAGAIEALLLRTLVRRGAGPRVGALPWLFCPAAVGGHVDHLAILLTVLRHRDLLGRHYRLAFYEDLYYASDPMRRQLGLAYLQRLLGTNRTYRVAWSLDEALQAVKLELVRLHGSQLTPSIDSLAAYTPAQGSDPAPHEAVWVYRSHQSPPVG